MITHGRPTPFDIPGFFSVGVGVATVTFVHAHRVEALLGWNAAWLVYLALIYWRARSTDGKLLNLPAGLFYGDAIIMYLMGLLLTSVYYVVYGAH